MGIWSDSYLQRRFLGSKFILHYFVGETAKKNTYVNWSNGFTFVLPKTYIRFSPSFSYSYDRRHGYYRSAEGNRLLGREGLDSIIVANDCGEDFLNLLSTQDIGRTHKWGTSGNADTRISLKALHMNTLGLQARYKYSHERGYDMQHYKLLAAGGTADMRNRYDNRPGVAICMES